jgi:hypothetical protein
MAIIIAASVVLLGLVGVLIKLARHFASPQQIPVTVEWIDQLSIERYQPMLRLLDEEDFRFMRTFSPEMVTKLRIQRCQIFRGYLHDLDDDFKRICSALKVLMVQSKQDRPELASALVKSQFTFAYTMVMVQARLACYRYGIGTVDVRALVKLFDGMRIELRTLVPVELGAGA